VAKQRLVAAVTLVVLLYTWWFFLGDSRVPEEPARDQITIDESERTLSFNAHVRATQGWVQFLLYADGYKWLENECALVSNVSLAAVQHAFASLDWRTWDELWLRQKQRPDIEVWLEYDGLRIEARTLLNLNEQMCVTDLIFLGSPYFDDVALDPRSSGVCNTCPLFPVEQQYLRQQFVRASGQSGYDLDEARMPPLHTKVLVTMRLTQ